MYARHYAKSFHIHHLTESLQAFEVDTINLPILLGRKSRLSRVKYFAQGHTISQRGSQVQSGACLTPEHALLPIR